MAQARKRPRVDVVANIALLPLWLVALFVYVGTVLQTVQLSFTDSRILPSSNFVGMQQYQELWSSARWNASLINLVVFGVLFVVCSLVLGFLLAVVLDRKLRMEGFFRTAYLFPYAMSLIVTGLVWQWLMNPTVGIQSSVRSLGWESFTFDWTTRKDMAIFALVIAGVWQASGVAMALIMSGMRGIDSDIWKATQVDGIPTWKVYLRIILPMLQPAILTAAVLLTTGVVKSYDLVVALTDGGPGRATEVPAKFVMDNLFNRQNIGLATAASTVMLVLTGLAFVPALIVGHLQRKKSRTAR